MPSTEPQFNKPTRACFRAPIKLDPEKDGKSGKSANMRGYIFWTTCLHLDALAADDAHGLERRRRGVGRGVVEPQEAPELDRFLLDLLRELARGRQDQRQGPVLALRGALGEPLGAHVHQQRDHEGGGLAGARLGEPDDVAPVEADGNALKHT